ncbi:MAG: DUF3617 family protein [Caulobacter sp.]|nr:DUF3617 family protein [Caulobacter sp.]
MKTISLLALTGLLGLAAAAPAVGQETTITPGWWQSTNKASMIISKTEVEQRCITPADVEKILAGRINRHYTCTYPEKRVGGGKMFFKGTCVDKRGRKVNITATGTYSANAFQLSADLSGKYGGIPLAASMSTTAHRLGDTCQGKPVKIKG